MKQTCWIGRRPPRNIVPTRAERSLLKLCRVQPILCNTEPMAPTRLILSTSERKISISRCFLYQCFGRYLIYFYTYWAMRWNDFALASAVLRAVPCGHSRKSFHRWAIVNGASVSAIRHISLSHGKKIAYLRLNKICVLDFAHHLCYLCNWNFAKKCIKTYDALIHYIRKNS